MKKIITKTFLVMMLIFSVLVLFKGIKVQAENTTELTVYYYRYDGNYTNYFLWMWTEHREGSGVKFQKVSEKNGYTYAAKFKVNADEQNDKFGMLVVHSGNPNQVTWGNGQTDNMYFYLKDNENAGQAKVDVYFAEGELEVAQSAADGLYAKREKFLYLSFSSNKKISYSATNAISDVVVYEDDGSGKKAVDASKPTAKSGSIELNNAMDVTKEYYVSCKVKNDLVEYDPISFEGIYSSATFNTAFEYNGDDLGATYSKESTKFRLWAPVSRDVIINLYHYGHQTKYGTEKYPGDDTPYATYPMTKSEKGTWTATIEGDLDGVYYTYTIVNSTVSNEVVDPYAKSTGLNGARGMIVNFGDDNEKLNPAKWVDTPRATATGNNVDKVLYETHIRDLTADPSWGGPEEYSGTFMGLSVRGTTYTKNGITVKTGLDHIAELGVTHVHILPVMDSEYVDETLLHDEEYKNKVAGGIYNWGYMTLSYFSLEGAYSTNPYDGYARMLEYKTMIQTMHSLGINIVMDVVYNHSSTAGDSSFHKILPKYYHRTSNGAFTNDSGCGNELASERSMVRKLIVDSCSFFVDEYKVDGLRFDLMGLEDTTTMNAVADAVVAIDPNTIIYGEPWPGNGTTAGYSPAAGGSGTYATANKDNLSKMPRVGAFSDATREGIRGDNVPTKGWIVGSFDDQRYDKTIFGIMGGAGYHNSAATAYRSASPNQIVNYASCHDNYSLYDQIKITTGWSITSKNTQIMNAVSQALSIVLTSQGVPFIEGGSEIGRSKAISTSTPGYDNKMEGIYELGNTAYNHNSYNAGDCFNAIKWEKKVDNLQYFNTIRNMIAIRRSHSAFRQTTYSAVSNVLANQNSTLYYSDGAIIAYRLKSNADSWKDIYVIHANSTAGGYTFSSLPAGNWKVAASNNPAHAFNSKFTSSTTLMANESIVLVNSTADLTLSMPSARPKMDGEGDAQASTIAVSSVGMRLNKVVESKNSDDIAKVFEYCQQLIASSNKLANTAKSSAKAKAEQLASLFTNGTSADFVSTTAVYDQYMAFYNSLMLAIDATDYASLFPVLPDELMAEIYAICNK